ncbi:glycosyltransferase family 4 protein [Rhizomonospora bruguierae]|uniref:glycosyltransferase family 4 protein n=1 Tax=Rhizomonospora bruguierae TaxID=1581705 RepID=UPI0020BDFAB3|nr:glycosyltransferase family 4 protein [Micromonospora sp. NBRC 107566]
MTLTPPYGVDATSVPPKRVLMLSWEYPPVVVGGLGRHVHALAGALAAAGHEVTVVTRHAPGAALDDLREGVRVVRAPEDPPRFPLATESLLAWTMAFNHTLTRAALRAVGTGRYDLIHAHDWLVTHTALTLKEHLGLPLVATIHATEAGRHQGWLPGEMNRAIHSVEHWLGHEADRVVVCSGYMKWEVNRLFGVAPEKLSVVPNGVDAARWRALPDQVALARRRFAGDGPLIAFAGRLVYEKGVQDLLAGLPALRSRHRGLRAVIAGDGPYKPHLERTADALGLRDVVTFAGFLRDDELPALMAASDGFVVPSIYEPFGMVALESAAAGAPLAVAATGGLPEIVEPKVTGMTFPARDPQSLADAVSALVLDADLARGVARQARAMVQRRYTWPTVAAATAHAYEWAGRGAGVPAQRGPLEITVPEGNLLLGSRVPTRADG